MALTDAQKKSIADHYRKKTTEPTVDATEPTVDNTENGVPPTSNQRTETDQNGNRIPDYIDNIGS